MLDDDKVVAAVRNYCSKYNIAQFAISPAIRINDLRQRKRNVEWPHGDHAGCYVMYDEGMTLLYVGLAGHIASRLNSWFKYNKRERAELPWTSYAVGTWQKQPEFLQTIQTHVPYEAPSLEAFLIGTLDPCENINFRNVPETAKFAKEPSTVSDWDMLAADFELAAAHFDQQVGTREGPSKEVLQQLDNIEGRLLNTEATTLEGLLLKAKVACWSMLGDWNAMHEDTLAARMAFSIVYDLVRKHAPHLLKPGTIDKLLSDL